jgi:SAM-dependent methyltransferase
MKNIKEWKPTKIKPQGTAFFVNSTGVAPSSLYITMEQFRILDEHKDYLHGHLVDLGCGDVPYYEWYKERVDKITCIDQPGTLHNKSHVDVFADLNQPLPLQSNSADCILLISVLEHIREPQVLLKEAQRILSDGGYLIISVPFLYHLHEEPFDYYRYTIYALKYIAQNAGLKAISTRHYGSAFGVLADISSKIGQSVIDALCNLLPKCISVVIKLVGYKVLRWYQQLCFVILKQQCNIPPF